MPRHLPSRPTTSVNRHADDPRSSFSQFRAQESAIDAAKAKARRERAIAVAAQKKRNAKA